MELVKPRELATAEMMQVQQMQQAAMGMGGDYAFVDPSPYTANVPVYGLQRHGTWGEVPEHRWYSKHFPAEYDYPWTIMSLMNFKTRRKSHQSKFTLLFIIGILFFLLSGCDMKKQPLSGQQAELFADPAKLSSFSQTKQVKVTNRHLEENDLDKHNYANFVFDDVEADRFFVQYAKLTNSTFKNSVFNIASFSRSTLTNVTFDNITFNDSAFIESTLVDVKFQNCTFNGTKFLGLKGQAKFINSTLNAPDFLEAQAILEFDNSTITNASDPRVSGFDMQKLPAAIYLKDSKLLGESTSGPIRVGGTLTAFKATGGSIINVGIGDNIKDVELSHAILDVSINGHVDNLSVESSQISRLAVGDTQFKHISISSCHQPVRLLSFIDGNFNDLTIDQCTIQKFEPWAAHGANLDIRNSTLIDSNFQDAKLGELTLNNVTVGNINLTNAQAGHVNTNKVSFTPNSQLKDSGSNIKLH